jgi:hypothetical protein
MLNYVTSSFVTLAPVVDPIGLAAHLHRHHSPLRHRAEEQRFFI